MGVVKDLWDYVERETEKAKPESVVLYFDLWKESHPQYIRTTHEITKEKQKRSNRRCRCLR